MIDNENLGRKAKGAIILIDKNGHEKRTRIDKAFKIVAPDGKKTDPTLDANGDFSADLLQAGAYTLVAALDNEEYVFAWSKVAAPTKMPQIDIGVQGGETDLVIYAWKIEKSQFGKDPKVDVQFAIDTAKGCVFLHDLMIAEGRTEAEAWAKVQIVLKSAFSNAPAVELLCTTCSDRYYTPGTPYYMNYPAYSTCMTKPPCT